MTKRQLIGQIITVNRSAPGDFLARFDDKDLRDYLDHLSILDQPRLTGDADRYAKYFTGPTAPTKAPTCEYGVLWSAGGSRAGILQNPFEKTRSAWIPYVRVDDPAALARYEVNAPFEEWNRPLFSLNMLADEVVVKPVAVGYTAVFPKPVRRSISNFMDNLTSPTTFANDLLQFEIGRASATFSRLLINTTIGVGGLFDPARHMGIEGHKEDFGQTLAVYGFGEGFYFMAPLLGPAPPRDLFGQLLVDLHTT